MNALPAESRRHKEASTLFFFCIYIAVFFAFSLWCCGALPSERGLKKKAMPLVDEAVPLSVSSRSPSLCLLYLLNGTGVWYFLTAALSDLRGAITLWLWTSA